MSPTTVREAAPAVFILTSLALLAGCSKQEEEAPPRPAIIALQRESVLNPPPAPSPSEEKPKTDLDGTERD
jgi:hypothetical protein